jgi:ABC-type nitrate/sulfonate/bicarbonate transport system permease component
MFAYIIVVGLIGVVLNGGVLLLTRTLWPAMAPRSGS